MATAAQTELLTIEAAGYVKQSSLDRSLKSALVKSHLQEFVDVRDRLVRFDFSAATWFDLAALIWLVPVMARMRRQGNVLELHLPPRPLDSSLADEGQSAENLWSALQRWEFFDVLSRCVDEPLNLLPPDQHAALLKPSRYSRLYAHDRSSELVPLRGGPLVELTIIDTGGQDSGISEAAASYNSALVRNNLRFHCRWSEADIDDFTQIVVPHAILNVAHAQASFAIVASRADDKFLHLCVADNGVGIPHLLRHAFHDQTITGRTDSALIAYFTGRELHEHSLLAVVSDSELVVASTAEHVSSDSARRGMGLFDLKTIVLERGGELRIRSGRAVVAFDGRKRQPTVQATATDDLAESPGTCVRVLLPREGGSPRRRR